MNGLGFWDAILSSVVGGVGTVGTSYLKAQQEAENIQAQAELLAAKQNAANLQALQQQALQQQQLSIQAAQQQARDQRISMYMGYGLVAGGAIVAGYVAYRVFLKGKKS